MLGMFRLLASLLPPLASQGHCCPLCVFFKTHVVFSRSLPLQLLPPRRAAPTLHPSAVDHPRLLSWWPQNGPMQAIVHIDHLAPLHFERGT